MKRYQDNQEKQLVQALYNLRLRCKPEFQTLMLWLRESRQEQQDTNDVLNGDDVTKGQGYSLCLRDIIKEMDSAPESLAALQAGT